MADFKATVEVDVIDAQLTDVEHRLDALKGKKIPVDVKLDAAAIQSQLDQIANGLKLNLGGLNVGKQVSQVGQSAAKAFSTAFNNNISVNNGGSQIQNLQRTLKSLNFKTDAITAVTQDLEKMEVSVQKVTSRLSGDGRNLSVKIDGVDELGRAVQVMKEFDAETGRVNPRSVETITQTFEDLGKVSQKASTYAKELEDLKAKFQSVLNIGDSGTNNFKKLVEDIDFSNIGSTAQLDEMVAKLKEAEAEGQRLNSLMNKKWASNAIEQIDKNLQDLPSHLTIIEEKFKSIGALGDKFDSATNIRDTISDLKTALSDINTIDNPEAKISAYNNLASTLQKLQNIYSETTAKQKNMFDDTDIHRVSSSLSELDAKFAKLGTVGESCRTKIQSLRSDLESLGESDGSERQVNDFKKIEKEIENLKSQYREYSNEIANAQAHTALLAGKSIAGNQLEAWMNKNTKAAKIYKTEIIDLKRQLESVSSASELSNVRQQISELKSRAAAENNLGMSWYETLFKNATKLSPLFGLGTMISYGMRGLKDIYQNVVSVDSAMTELRKVSSASDVELSSYFEKASDSAQKYGASIKDVISSTADWSRLGYNLEEASYLSDMTTLLQKVGDNMSQESASKGLISILKGFQLDYEEAGSIVDKLNEVANTQPIDTAGLTEALERSASSLSAANNDLSESIALVTAANSVVQDPASVGTALKTISMRIRGAETELKEAGLEVDGMAESTAKLREEMLALSGVDIMLDENTFKSTYEILEELSTKWQDLTDIQRASVTELIAGKRQGNVVNALMTNFDIARDAKVSANNSLGSAEKELENWNKSIEASIAHLKAAWEALSTDILSSGLVKGVVDVGTAIVQTIDKIVESFGAVQTLFAGGFLVSGIASIA